MTEDLDLDTHIEELKGNIIEFFERERPIEFFFRVALLYHYPVCWDTVAYPTLFDAVSELRGPCTTCEVKDPKTDGHVHEWVEAVVKDRPSYDFWLCLKCGDISPGPTDNENIDPRKVVD